MGVRWVYYGFDMVIWVMIIPNNIPSGKRLHSYGKSPCLTGKSTTNGKSAVNQLSINDISDVFFLRMAGMPWHTGEMFEVLCR